jgi:D-alanyl-lipoteichoic acid acyltransferase DltB (MBOAT superfamily)
MAFDTFVFLQFFVALLLLYWLVRRSLQARNLLIVAASYLFYGWWDYRFLALILFSSLLDFAVGLALEREAQPRRRKGWLLLSLTGNLGVLGFFKYYDFFVESFGALATKLGWPVEARTLNIILPVGISFYTFQTMSYALDVYRRQMPATRSLTNFLAYVSFFPQLVAGPIERAQHLLPQFERTRNLTRPMLEEGVWLILWGLFKKVALADNFAPLVEMAYEQPAATAPVVVLGTIAFGLQIYCDFSGYSDIARGLARVLGFDIMVNFDVPYAAASLREFWRRWHISLSSWLRDYLYISLGGNRCGEGRTYLNLLLTMLLGGLWHGASWNFALWGLWHGLGLAVERRFGAARPRGPDGSALTLQRSLCWASTMLFVF